MLVTTAILDSYGAGREFSDPAVVGVDFDDPSKFISHHKWHLAPGEYTDDTAMSVGVAEVLVEKGFYATKLDFANKFVEVFQRDLVDGKPREGYAKGFYDFLLTVTSGQDMLDRIIPTSDRNGAAMRSGPCGVIRNVETLFRTVNTHASITHNTTDGIVAAYAAALMTHFCIYNFGDRERIGEYVEAILGTRVPWNTDWEGKVTLLGPEAVRAAITAIKRHDNLQDIMVECVKFTGDVDTVAAIAGSAASCHPQIKSNLHPNLWATLENGKYGKDFLVELDIKLMALRGPLV